MATKKKFSQGVFDKKQRTLLGKRLKRVQQLFDTLSKQAALIGMQADYNDITEDFVFEQYPAVKREIDALLDKFSNSMQLNVERAEKGAWAIANAKADALINSVTVISGLKSVANEWKVRNEAARDAFITRKTAGMNLSDRIWRIRNQTRTELELALEMGLARGKSAAELSRDIRHCLKDPNMLFRRVKNEKGVLRLSKAAAAYHPGRGKYRSSYKNALRVTATETNMAYYKADYERWKDIPFVIGQHIQTSNNHPVTDICDDLQGDYPKSFVFTGWHPFCRCTTVAILAKEEEFLDYQQRILNGEDVSDYKFSGAIDDVPNNFQSWTINNGERIIKARSRGKEPYFLRENTEKVNKVLGIEKKGASIKGSSRSETHRVLNEVIDEKYTGKTSLTEKQQLNLTEVCDTLGIEKNVQPMTFFEADGGKSNVFASKFENNCVSCVFTNELRRRGVNVTAISTPDNLANDFLQCWRTEKGDRPILVCEPHKLVGKNAQETLAKIEKNMTAKNGRYILGWDGKDLQLGHALCVERINGNIIFYDPQLGKNDCFWTIGEIFKTARLENGLELFRVDKLLFNTSIIKNVCTSI